MAERHTSLEIIAPSVEEAVEKGLTELGLAAEAVDVDILDIGTKGLFGLGSRLARVRLTIKGGDGTGELKQAAAKVIEAAHSEAIISQAPIEQGEAWEEDAQEEEEETSDLELEDDELLQIAMETVEDLLDRMKIRARLEVHWGVPEDPKDRTPLIVDIHGDDLSILIGPKAETLNALQYISGLIVSKEVGYSVPLVVDVEGYRVRRSRQIRQLAQRMAEQAVRTGRRQVLEPMPANERRLVHIELRDNSDVTTESVGEDPRRKVTIIPK